MTSYEVSPHIIFGARIPLPYDKTKKNWDWADVERVATALFPQRNLNTAEGKDQFYDDLNGGIVIPGTPYRLCFYNHCDNDYCVFIQLKDVTVHAKRYVEGLSPVSWDLPDATSLSNFQKFLASKGINLKCEQHLVLDGGYQ